MKNIKMTNEKNLMEFFSSLFTLSAWMWEIHTKIDSHTAHATNKNANDTIWSEWWWTTDWIKTSWLYAFHNIISNNKRSNTTTTALTLAHSVHTLSVHRCSPRRVLLLGMLNNQQHSHTVRFVVVSRFGGSSFYVWCFRLFFFDC